MEVASSDDSYSLDILIPPEVRCFRYGVQIHSQAVFGCLGILFESLSLSSCIYLMILFLELPPLTALVCGL